MDVSCFYMKTCTFRNSKRRWNYTDLFCNVEPKAYYGMKKCEDRNCRFCYERSDLTKRLERAMNFSNKQIHRLIPDCQKKLYTHSTQCSVALQLFLKCHPEYWCFVPMTKEQVRIDNADITSEERYLLAKYQDLLAVETQTSIYERNMTLVRWCVNHVPSPPPNYEFSLRQIIEQYEFFRSKSDSSVTRFLDLYNAAIVIALPENASNVIRHTIQALLIIYAEPKLVVTTNEIDRDGLESTNVNDNYWCQHLLYPRLSRNSNAMTT
ncbi:unnamed protein product [Rotaria sp. Silwood2]|nr:unnamed protein product [Rotaria sp. Silwood2]